MFERRLVERKRFGSPCAKCVDNDIEPDEIFARQIEQIFDYCLCLGVFNLIASAHKSRYLIPAGDRLVHQQLALLACRTNDSYFFHDKNLQKIFCFRNLSDYGHSISNIKKFFSEVTF